MLDLKIPDFMSNMTTLLQTEGTNINEVLIIGIYMLLCALGSLFSSILVGYFATNIGASFSKNLRSDIFRKVESFGMEEIKKFLASSLITRTTNDITHVQMFISMGLQMLIKAPIMATWAIIKIQAKNFSWTFATISAIFFLLIMITTLILFALPKFKIIQKLTDNLNNVTRENLTGIRVVRAFNAEDYQENKFNKANKNLMKTSMFTGKLMNILSPGMNLIMSGLTLSIYAIGAFIINQAEVVNRIDLFSDMIVFSSYAMQVVMSFVMLSFIFIIYPRASISAKRIREVLDTKSSILDGDIDKDNNIKGEIEFKNVSFKYPDANEYMLKDITFKVNKGETVAFIGSTGCGKSTLINLIPRFYDATEGVVLIDNINVKNYKLETLYNKLGYIPQKAVMFSGSVKYNVSYGKSKNKINDAIIKKSVSVAQGADFVEELDKKYDSYISRGGTNISGGQKQRLAISRAIARNPEIYIFDDSFSALDYKTDYKLRKELKKYTKDATILIVAQRIGTIRNADKIIVLDNGRMVGMGTHNELLNNCKVYQEIALSQVTKEELENE